MSASDEDLWPEPEPEIIPVPDVLFSCSYGEGFTIPIIEAQQVEP